MSEVKVNKISPRTNCGTVQLGDSGDTITIPAGATITNNGTQTGFGRTGTVDWDTTAKTTNFTAVSGNGYFVNTTSGSITVTLPAGSAGDIVGISDYASTAQTNNILVAPNGTDKINGVNQTYYIATQGLAVTLVYVDATKGWKSVTGSDADATGIVAAFVTATGGTVTCCGDYKIHTFTSPGTFTVTCAGNFAGSNTVDYLVVAGGGGGGGGGASDSGGGGGAGGFRLANATSMPAPLTSPLATPTALPVTATGYPITVGSGGGGAPGPGNKGSSGSNSVFSTITSSGGGGGAADNNSLGVPGGSGGAGGGSHPGPLPATLAGSGNTPPVSPPQGNDGGPGSVSPVDGANILGGGGGGAGAVGQGGGPWPVTVPNQQYGGIGSYVLGTGFAGSNGTTGPVCGARYFAGGGGGGNAPARSPIGNSGQGGAGGGGNLCGNATTNTGGGGGGGSNGGGGNGGSGIIIIRYKYQ